MTAVIALLHYSSDWRLSELHLKGVKKIDWILLEMSEVWRTFPDGSGV